MMKTLHRPLTLGFLYVSIFILGLNVDFLSAHRIRLRAQRHPGALRICC